MKRHALTLGLVALVFAGLLYQPATAEQSATTATGSTLAPILAQRLPKAGAGFAYDLIVDGTLTITQPIANQKADVQRQAVHLQSGLEVRWDAKTATTPFPARLNLVAPHLTAGGKVVPLDAEATSPITAKFDGSSQLLSVQTPQVLRDLGLDLTQVLLGLTVPMSVNSAGPGASWVVRAVLEGPNKGFDLRTTYTLVNFEERRGANLAYIRGSIALTPKDGVGRSNYVGYVEAYVDPANGRVLESGMSLDVTTKVNLPAPKTNTTEEATIRTVITTLLLDLGPASAVAPTPAPVAAKPETVRPTPTPKASVGQQGADTPAATTNTQPNPQPATLPAAPATRPTATTTVNTITNVGGTTATWQDNLYRDPAGRYAFALPKDWTLKQQRITADTTAFAGPAAPQMIYVFAAPADAKSLSDFARTVLNTYTQASKDYRLISDLRPVQVAGVSALTAQYAYPDTVTGVTLGEVAVFTQHQGMNYIMQYSDTQQKMAGQWNAVVDYLAGALAFGGSPNGGVPANQLQAAEVVTYTDPLQRFALELPVLWPLLSRSNETGTVTFTEIGKQGFLSVYVQPGMDKYQAETVLGAWRAQWAKQERGYEELSGQYSTYLGGKPGSGLTYTWINVDGQRWQRRAQAVMFEGTFYALVIDYVATGASDRDEVFTRMANSFRFLTAMAILPPSSTTSSAEPAASTPATSINAVAQADTNPAGAITGGGQVYPVTTIRLEEPLDNSRALLAGRLGMRQGSDIRWLGGVTVRVRAGQSLYATRTDQNGYFAFANIAPLGQGNYALVDAEGLFPGYTQPATATFNNVEIAARSGRFIDAGYILMDMQSSGAFNTTLVLPGQLADPYEVPRNYLNGYPFSSWAPVLRSVMQGR